jgi:hypothetical protein
MTPTSFLVFEEGYSPKRAFTLLMLFIPSRGVIFKEAKRKKIEERR